jgi:hypothetical protein
MATIAEIAARIKELELQYQQVRGGKGTSELTNDERNKIIAISEWIENDEEKICRIFNTKGKIILYGSTCVYVLDDGKEKYIATLDRVGSVISYRQITDDQYNSFAQQ